MELLVKSISVIMKKGFTFRSYDTPMLIVFIVIKMFLFSL